VQVCDRDEEIPLSVDELKEAAWDPRPRGTPAYSWVWIVERKSVVMEDEDEDEELQGRGDRRE
jgi:hypothetical protein